MSEDSIGRRVEKEAHRGAIVRLIVPFYGVGMTFAGLRNGLMIEAKPLDDEEIEFHLLYLEESGYLKRDRETPRHKKPRTVRVHPTRKAVDLLDQRIAEDPGVKF